MIKLFKQNLTLGELDDRRHREPVNSAVNQSYLVAQE